MGWDGMGFVGWRWENSMITRGKILSDQRTVLLCYGFYLGEAREGLSPNPIVVLIRSQTCGDPRYLEGLVFRCFVCTYI